MPALHPRLNQHQLMVMGRINHYLGRLVLDEGQRLWLKTEVLTELNRLPENASPEEALNRGFGALQRGLGDLYQGEEWEGRSGLQQVLTITGLSWNARKPICRTSMASLPLNRSWKAALLRGLRSLRPAWSTSFASRHRLSPERTTG